MNYLDMGGRIRHFRQQKDLSIDQLAKAIAISVEEIEAFESNQSVPSIAILIKLSKNLDINVADVFRERPREKKFEILREKDQQKYAGNSPSKECGYRFVPLTYPTADKHLDSYLIEIPAQQEREGVKKEGHPGEEFVFLLEGELHGEIGGESFVLKKGDSLFLRSSTPHRYFNPTDQDARAIAVVYPYS